jgi:hypothetical protein
LSGDNSDASVSQNSSCAPDLRPHAAGVDRRFAIRLQHGVPTTGGPRKKARPTEMLLKRQSIAEIPAVGRAELHKKSVALALQ